jgi:hypothetical protein
MKIYEANNQADLEDELFKIIERNCEKELSTVQIIGESDDDLEAIAVFKDESTFMCKIMLQKVDGKMASGVRGNFIQ